MYIEHVMCLLKSQTTRTKHMITYTYHERLFQKIPGSAVALKNTIIPVSLDVPYVILCCSSCIMHCELLEIFVWSLKLNQRLLT